MIRRIIGAILAIPTMIGKLGTWLLNPKNGSEYVSPFSRQYLSTGTTLAVTVLYRTGEGLYNFLTSYVLGSLVYIVEVAAGVVADLWNANPSYTRWVLRGLISGGEILISITIEVVKMAFNLVKELINAFR